MKVGEAFVTVRPDTKGFEGETKSKLIGPLKAAALAGGALVGFGLKKAFDFVKGGVRAASDLNETVSKGRKIFGDSFRSIDSWARGAVSRMGLTRGEAISNASAFGDLFRQLKIGEKPATSMSKSMVQLAADFASFHNADISEVLNAQASAFRGEFDALQRFVPGITAARVEQEALRQTHKKSAKDLTDAEKAQAAYNIMLRDGKRAAGDFKDTSQEQANQQRILGAQTRSLATTIGSFFLPGVLAVTRALTGALLPQLTSLAQTHGPRVEAIFTRMGNSVAGFIRGADFSGLVTTGIAKLEAIGPRVADSFGQIASKVSEMRAQAGPAAVETSRLATAASLGGAVLDFLGRNMDTVVRNLPLLVAGFAAYKATQAAANVATVAAVPATLANAASNFALAAANRSVATAISAKGAATVGATGVTIANTGANNVSALTVARTAAAWVASRVAMLAAAVATGVATAAQWALNVALSANPIGIVVIAIAAIVAAIIGWVVVLKKLYRENETFRRIVQTAWRGVQVVIATAKAVIGAAISAIGGFLASLASRAVSAGGRIRSGWETVAGFFRSLPGRIVSFLAGLPGRLFSIGANMIAAFGRGIASAAGAAIGAVSGVVSRIRGLLPGSPAKYGPLSGSGAPERTGRTLAQDFAKGILRGSGAIRRAGDRALGLAAPSPLPGPGTARSGASTSIASGAVQVNVYTSGPTAAADVQAAVERAFAVFQRQLLTGARV